MTTMHMLETAEAAIVYDVHGPLPTADGRPPLLMIAQPMDASGFSALASHSPTARWSLMTRAGSAAASVKTAESTIHPRSRRVTCTR